MAGEAAVVGIARILLASASVGFSRSARGSLNAQDLALVSFYDGKVKARTAHSLLVLALGLQSANSFGARGSGAPSVAELACYERPAFWKRVKDKGADDYCKLVDRARARLYSSPADAKALSEKARRLRPPGVSAGLLHAHAELLLGASKEAHAEFTRVVSDLSSPDVAPFLTPTDVAAGARAALLEGAFADALARYRWVLLRLDEFKSPHEEARLLIEAASAVQYALKDGGREARAYLSLAEAKNAALLRPIIQAARALSLLRDGDSERARREVAHLESTWALSWMFEGQNPVGVPREPIPVFPRGEKSALLAAIAESVEPEAAKENWEQFFDEAGPEIPEHLKRRPEE